MVFLWFSHGWILIDEPWWSHSKNRSTNICLSRWAVFFRDRQVVDGDGHHKYFLQVLIEDGMFF